MIQVFSFSETSPSAPGTVASSQKVIGALGGILGVASDLSQYSSLSVEANLVGATGGTLDVYIQYNPSADRANWYDFVHFTQLAAAAAALSYVASFATGAQNLTLAAVGKNLSPALATNTSLGGGWGDAFRLLFVAGAGTSAGALITVNVTGQRIDVWPR